MGSLRVVLPCDRCPVHDLRAAMALLSGATHGLCSGTPPCRRSKPAAVPGRTAPSQQQHPRPSATRHRLTQCLAPSLLRRVSRDGVARYLTITFGVATYVAFVWRDTQYVPDLAPFSDVRHGQYEFGMVAVALSITFVFYLTFLYVPHRRAHWAGWCARFRWWGCVLPCLTPTMRNCVAAPVPAGTHTASTGTRSTLGRTTTCCCKCEQPLSR